MLRSNQAYRDSLLVKHASSVCFLKMEEKQGNKKKINRIEWRVSKMSAEDALRDQTPIIRETFFCLLNHNL